MALARAVDQPVAFLFGREDNGLPNSALDLCHAILTIPTAPDYASLNLAQAVMIVAYEARLASLHLNSPPSGPVSAPATVAETEAMFETLEAALHAIDFLVPGRTEPTLRALRALILRAEPTAEEAALLTALARAIAKRGGPG
jgi:TrmH family RNA methyltransferase